MKTAKRPHKGSLLLILRVRQDARENLIRHFNRLRVREGLRFWIDTEVRWLIVSAKMYLVFGPFMSDSEWFTGAKESLERFGKLGLKMGECIDSMPHSAWEGLLRQVAPKVGTPLFLSKGFFPLLAEMTLALAKRPAANPKGGAITNPLVI